MPKGDRGVIPDAKELFQITQLELWWLLLTGYVLGAKPFGPGAIPIIAWIAVNLVLLHWWRGYCGLDQWPKPYGRYYKQWLALKGSGDYYVWLARHMGNREPWRSWAKWDK